MEETLWLCIAFLGVFSIIGVVNIFYLRSTMRVCPTCKGERCKVVRAGNVTIATEICKDCNGTGIKNV
jgi:DnaJ-class molecular chaperone